MTDKSPQLYFTEAIDFLKHKIKLPTAGWTDIWEQQHSHAFVVAGANHDALVEDLYNAIAQAKWAGGGYAEFQNSFNAITEKYGWAYHGTPGWRSRIIYDTNITQAYNAGRYQQMMAVKHLNPFWQYEHTNCQHPRVTHLAWNGLILPADDPWFDTHYPQNGWGCHCRVHALSHYEAEQQWQKTGKFGPDQAPPMDWEEKTVGKNSATPRTVRVPKGIDPGFGYNPGKAYLEPLTVPPLPGYQAVLKERDTPWPTSFKPPPAPKPSKVSENLLLPADTKPEVAVQDFLDVFGATLDKGAVFTDAADTSMAITKALFVKGDKSGDNFKWLADPKKADRLQYINLLAMTLIEPDEIWWEWVKDNTEKGRWRLKRRYLRAFEIAGIAEYAVSVFEWGRTGWTGATAFMTTQKTEAARQAYFDKMRTGKLVYDKSTDTK